MPQDLWERERARWTAPPLERQQQALEELDLYQVQTRELGDVGGGVRELRRILRAEQRRRSQRLEPIPLQRPLEIPRWTAWVAVALAALALLYLLYRALSGSRLLVSSAAPIGEAQRVPAQVLAQSEALRREAERLAAAGQFTQALLLLYRAALLRLTEVDLLADDRSLTDGEHLRKLAGTPAGAALAPVAGAFARCRYGHQEVDAREYSRCWTAVQGVW